MKRKADHVADVDDPAHSKRRIINQHDRFREGLFEKGTLEAYKRIYQESQPYRHGVIQSLIEPGLLKKVGSEIQNLSFTPKETDIYKIHQSGDLANLDGLDDSSLKLLPSLLILRDAMYSSDFRQYLANITGSGPLSGKKTDMSINVYTPGCHLLCHDDVIGSRRVSYILYLTDPDRPWERDWGGTLRLYPTKIYDNEDGTVTKVPAPDYSVSIPPAFNQLSFFEVQPGESFHDVEEVYGVAEDIGTGKERVRMAISGWYHIPQEGEDGYEAGLEERLSQKSSLVQLQSKADDYDLPKASIATYSNFAAGGLPTPSSQDELPLSPQDIDFLLKYIAPTYLTPDPLKEVHEMFSEDCSICLENFMCHKFSTSVKDYVLSNESDFLPSESSEIERTTSWKVARPPHKHRFLFQQDNSLRADLSPLQDILQNLIPSKAFQKWLSIATGFQVLSYDSCARRFRRGQDYTLATGYGEDSPQIEICLGLTPTPGWGGDPPVDPDSQGRGETKSEKDDDAVETIPNADNAGVGGYLAYMAGDEEDENSENDGASSDHGVEVPPDLSTGARATKASGPKKSKQDPAVYKASGDDEDDNILFSMPAGWNRLGIVLRDKGTMRFVKYVSRKAKGDRWDIVGEFGVLDEEDDDEDQSTEHDEESANSAAGALAGQQEDEEDSNEHVDTDDDSDSED